MYRLWRASGSWVAGSSKAEARPGASLPRSEITNSPTVLFILQEKRWGVATKRPYLKITVESTVGSSDILLFSRLLNFTISNFIDVIITTMALSGNHVKCLVSILVLFVCK